MIEVSEMYVAPQGEGPNMGRPSLFLRLHRCNLQCVWCDSKFSWDASLKEFDEFTTYDEAAQLVSAMLQVSNESRFFPTGLVITGGEPLLWGRHLIDLVLPYYEAAQTLHDTTVGIEIETAGTIEPPNKLIAHVHFNVSHKMASSQNSMPRNRLWNERILRKFIRASAIFKPVMTTADVFEIVEYVDWLVSIGGPEMRDRVYLMPEGRTREELAQHQVAAVELAQEIGTRVTTRMHILAYGDERKR